jgi:hypothetical protein
MKLVDTLQEKEFVATYKLQVHFMLAKPTLLSVY